MRHTVTMGGGSRGIRRAGPARDLEAGRLLRRVHRPRGPSTGQTGAPTASHFPVVLTVYPHVTHVQWIIREPDPEPRAPSAARLIAR